VEFLVNLSWDCSLDIVNVLMEVCDVNCRRRDRIRDDMVRHGGVVDRR